MSKEDMYTIKTKTISPAIDEEKLRRERIATALLQNFLNGGKFSKYLSAHEAVKCADILIAELDRSPGETE